MADTALPHQARHEGQLPGEVGEQPHGLHQVRLSLRSVTAHQLFTLILGDLRVLIILYIDPHDIADFVLIFFKQICS